MKLNKKTQRLLLIGILAGVVIYYFYNKGKKSNNEPSKVPIDNSVNDNILAPEPTQLVQPTPTPATQATTQPSTTTAITAPQPSNNGTAILVPTNNTNTSISGTVLQVQAPVMSAVPGMPSNFTI